MTHADVDSEDHFDDRRLSDLLPTDFIRQIGFDPQTFVFNPNNQQMRRRMTDPGLGVMFSAAEPPGQRRMTTSERYQPTSPLNMINFLGSPLIEMAQITNWFLVEINDMKVNAFSTFHCETATSDSVVVRDGSYLRFGRIIKEIKAPSNFDRSSPQILYVDSTPLLSDYIFSMNQISKSMIPIFLKKSNIQSELISVETVSYDARAMFRIKLSNASVPNIDKFIRFVIQTFGIAVEVYD